jgi:twinkle protein
MSLNDLHLVSREPIGPQPEKATDEPISIDDLASDILDLYETGLQPGVRPEWISLCPYYTVKPGQVTIVTGIPHSGKSPFVNALALHCAATYGWLVVWCSPEHMPYADLSARLLEQYYKVLSFTSGHFKMTRAQILNACAELKTRCYFLEPREENPTLQNILDRCLPLLDRGLKGLVIDPYGEFEHRIPDGMSETKYISGLLSTVRAFARKHAVHIWIVAHPTKIQKGDDGNYLVVKPYDISGSAAWFSKPDNILSVYRTNEQPDMTQIHIQKVKFREVGHTGSVTLRHDARTGTFYDVPIEQEGN